MPDTSPIPIVPSSSDLAQCVRCGLCLQSCPTYVQTGLETESPRGRLYLMKALAEGEIEPTANVIGHMDQCLQCRNCEAVCPSGVPFGRIMERTRAGILEGNSSPFSWRLRSLFLRHVIAQPKALSIFAAVFRLYGRTGLRTLVERIPGIGERALLAPTMEGRPFTKSGLLARPDGEVRQRVALLTGCIMPHAFGRVHRATVRVLARNGCEVEAPPDQVCCGALHAHNGDLNTAMDLARRNIDVFLGAGVDAVIVNSAGCGAAMKEYDELLAGDSEYRDAAKRFSTLVKDISEFLVDLPFKVPSGQVQATVTYQDSCHLAHAQRITSAPREILRSIASLTLVEMDRPDGCCGSAGVYSLTQPKMSIELLDEKMRAVSDTKASVIATSNPGCMSQLESGLRRHGAPGEVVHVVELLDRAYPDR
ncbi:MAG: 4Fe-4S dicluster domain-containing protein [Chloroflexi bacterium]|nr:4Fe-4S dicluster domain-containing protein [Chloroflexota bacterium]